MFKMWPKTGQKLIIFNLLVSCSLLAIEAWIRHIIVKHDSGILMMFYVGKWWTARGCLPIILGIKVLSGSSLTGSDKVRLSLLTLTLDSDHNPPFSHQYPISASEQPILRAWTWDPCIYFYKISTAWNSQNSCIVCWRFCLRLVIEEILWMEVSGV